MSLRRIIREYVLSFFHPVGRVEGEVSDIKTEFSPVSIEGAFAFGQALARLSRHEFHNTSGLGRLLRAAKADDSTAAVDRLATYLPEYLKSIDWPAAPHILVTLPDGRPSRHPSATHLLADRIAGHLDCQTGHGLFSKTRLCPPQKMRSWRERLADAAPRYSLAFPETIRDRVVLLFDDVYATGQSIDEATRLLVEGGAQAVMVLVLVQLTP